MQHPTVEKLFLEQCEYYSRKDQSAAKSPIISLFSEWAKSKKIKKSLKICEFGGGGGLILSQIGKMAKFKVELYNVEFIDKYRQYQISSKIKFYHQSILNSKFPNHSFDVLILRDVLHHLIGQDFRHTQENQETAIFELKRLLRPGGVVFIEELISSSSITAKLIYYFSKINSKIGLRFPTFEINPNTIVAFLTAEQLLIMIKGIFHPKILKKIYLPFNQKWQSRIVHLGFSSSKLILVIDESNNDF